VPQLVLASVNPKLPARPAAQWAHDIRNTLAILGLHLETLTRLSGSRGRDVADAAPAILPNGVLNVDYSVNSALAPALAGSAFQIFATGLPLNGTISGRVHDIDIFTPLYAGPAPGAIGIQQVNLQIHPLFLTFQTFVYVCGQVSGGPRTCSPAVPIWLQKAP